MMCDDCKKQPALVHVTQVAGGQKTELHLCLSCANQRNIQIWPILGQLAPGFAPIGSAFIPPEVPDRVCPQCHATWREFITTGFLGCSKCYDSFADLLGTLITKNYGPIRHHGKIPMKGAGPIRLRREIADLQSDLEAAVGQEDFEKAASLRDQIRQLEKKT